MVHRGLVALSLQRVAEAGANAAHARRLVRLLRASALSGGPHDPLVFDAAVRAHRRAEREARGALKAWASSPRRAPRPVRTAGQSPEQWAA